MTEQNLDIIHASSIKYIYVMFYLLGATVSVKSEKMFSIYFDPLSANNYDIKFH